MPPSTAITVPMTTIQAWTGVMFQAFSNSLANEAMMPINVPMAEPICPANVMNTSAASRK